MGTETDELDDDEYVPEESCPACGRRPRFMGQRKNGRLHVYRCSECGLLFEAMNPHAPKQRTQRRNGEQGTLF